MKCTLIVSTKFEVEIKLHLKPETEDEQGSLPAGTHILIGENAKFLPDGKVIMQSKVGGREQ